MTYTVKYNCKTKIWNTYKYKSGIQIEMGDVGYYFTMFRNVNHHLELMQIFMACKYLLQHDILIYDIYNYIIDISIFFYNQYNLCHYHFI